MWLAPRLPVLCWKDCSFHLGLKWVLTNLRNETWHNLRRRSSFLVRKESPLQYWWSFPLVAPDQLALSFLYWCYFIQILGPQPLLTNFIYSLEDFWRLELSPSQDRKLYFLYRDFLVMLSCDNLRVHDETRLQVLLSFINYRVKSGQIACSYCIFLLWFLICLL